MGCRQGCHSRHRTVRPGGGPEAIAGPEMQFLAVSSFTVFQGARAVGMGGGDGPDVDQRGLLSIRKKLKSPTITDG